MAQMRGWRKLGPRTSRAGCRRSGLAVLLCLAVFAAGCEQLPGEPLYTPTPIPTPTQIPKPVHRVERGDIEHIVTLLGVVDSVRRANLFFRTSGRLKEFLVLPGDAVVEGQVLAALEVGFAPQDLLAAETVLEMAELRLEGLKLAQQEELAQEQRSVALARERLELAVAANSDPELAAARSGWENAEAALREARRAYNRVAGSSGAANSAEASALQQALRQRDQARQAYDRMIGLVILEDGDLGALQEEIQRAQASVEMTAAQHEIALQLLEKEIALAELDVQKMEAQLSQMDLRAPFAGVVRYTLGDPGVWVDEFDPILGLADVSALEVRSATSDINTARFLRLGQEAGITFREYPERVVSGELIQVIAPARAGEDSLPGEAEKRLPIRIAFSAPELALKIGMLADIDVVIERKQDVLLIPNSTIQSYFNRRYVLVKQGDQQIEVDVVLGVSDGETTEVVAGLEEGELVFER